ncbi:MurR/RpiR family transcriptional regulator [Bifidobacterium apri]|nr:SIS domain-containing protein [Bifidobacterium apri]
MTTHKHTHPPSTRIQSTQKRFTDKKRTIYVAGGRFSTAVARILALNLQLLRPNVMLLDDLDQKDKGCLLDMNRRSVFMVFDFARYQKNIIRAAHVAKQKGATIVLISDGELSPIKTDASIVLPISTDSFLPLSGMATATAIIEILLSDVYTQIGSSANEHLTEWELLTGGETVE